ncbi:MAG: GNAT family N-acetyltransferase [Vicinamibacterales bacterium]
MAEIQTPRLRLRPPEAADVQPMVEIHRDPDVMRHLAPGGPDEVATAWRNVALMIGHWHMRGYGPWIITARDSGDILGRAGLWNAEGGPGLELGWMVRRSMWGRGIATEAARAARDWAWQHLDSNHIVGIIHATNVASVRIAEKLGARLEDRKAVDGAEVLTYGLHRTRPVQEGG